MKEFLDRNFPPPFQGMKIRDWLMQRTEPGYVFLRAMLIRIFGDDRDRNFEVDSMVQALAKLGIDTPQELDEFVNNPISSQFITRIESEIIETFPRFGWESTMTRLNNKAELLDAVVNSPFTLQPDFSFDRRYYRDSYYMLLPPTKSPVQDILSQSKVSGYQYHPESRDCDDMTKLFFGELAKAKRGHYSFGEIEFTCYDVDSNPVYRHNLACSVHEGGEFRMIDPHSQKTWRHPDETPSYDPGQDSIKIDWVRL